MLDNQTTMRSMLTLIESVSKNTETTQLNEGMYEAQDIEDRYPDPDTLADGALDAAARYIQDALGIKTGDFAGMFFSGDNGITITNILSDYATAEMNNMRDSEEELDEEQDPNLAKAYHMGNEAYKAYKNDPARAQAAQDKFDDMEIVKKNPEYSKMWVTGYRDGERFDKESNLKEAASRKDFRQVADIIKQIPDLNKRKELADHHAEIFKQQNPRFSREKFMRYIGL